MSKNKKPNEDLHAFRADEELTDLLNSESNKSETIVRALREHYRREHAITCPMCSGTGYVYNPPKIIKPRTILRKKK